MSNWRAMADEALSEDKRDIRDKSPPSVPSVPSVPTLSSPEIVRRWRKALGSLDPEAARYGIAPKRWRQWVEDARWLLDKYGEQAARDGWDALDLFGRVPGREDLAGLAGRLRGSRSLVMTEHNARWRSIGGVGMSFGRGGMAGCIGLVPLWQAQA